MMDDQHVVVWPPMMSGYTPTAPTWIETRMYTALRVLGVPFEAQYVLGPYTLDAYLPDYDIALESMGCSWHGCPEHYSDDQIEVDYQAKKTARRTEVLRLRFGVETINLWGHSLGSDDEALATVRSALEPYGVRMMPPESETV